MAEYLLAEVLERQSEEVQRLLLRTSVAERVSGELADLLTGGSGGRRVLQDLEQAGAFVVSLDAGRSWFRYHRLFADLLQLELRRTAPGELPALQRAAAGWFAEHGYPVDAVRHAQAAGDWGLAAQLLFDTWLSVTLDSQQDTAHELLTGFPADIAAGDPELIALAAADELNRGSFEEAERHLARATRELASVPAERRGRFQVTLGILRLLLGRQRSDLPAVAEEARRLLAPVEAEDTAELGMSGERRALALISLGIAETWSYRHDEAERHLEQGVALARQIGRPYLELTGLAHGARIAVVRSHMLGAQRSRQAIELAERHGWSEEPIAGVAYAQLATVMGVQGQLEEAERCLERAERTLRAELEPAAGVELRWARAGLELDRGRPERALDAFQAAERLAGLLLTPYANVGPMRAQALQTRVRLGQTDRVEAALAEMDDQERDTAVMRSVIAALRLAGDDPQAAAVALGPVVAGSVPAGAPVWLVEALLLEAVTRDALGDPDAVGRALERALDLAEPDRMLFPFLLHPEPGLLERHARQRTAHSALIADILSLLARRGPGGEGGREVPPKGTLGGWVPPGKTAGRVWEGSLPLRGHCANRSARPRPASCAICPPTCPRRRSPTSSPCRRTPSGRTCATSTTSSAPTAVPRPSSGPAPLACSHPPRARAELDRSMHPWPFLKYKDLQPNGARRRAEAGLRFTYWRGAPAHRHQRRRHLPVVCVPRISSAAVTSSVALLAVRP